MMHQEPLIIDDFTVGENVWLYKLREGRDIRPWAQKVDTNSAETRKVLQGVGLGHLSTRQFARDLGPGQRQMLSLSRAAVTTHKIMILDETTASTSEEHFNDILDLVDREKKAGTSIIFVSHRLNEVFAMCDRIAVLRNGKLVKTLNAADSNPDEITTLMIGQALKALARPAPVQSDPDQVPVMSVRDLYGGAARGCLVRRQSGRDRRSLRAGRQRPILRRAHHHRSAPSRQRLDQAARRGGQPAHSRGRRGARDRLPDRGPPPGGLRQGLRQRREHEPRRAAQDGQPGVVQSAVEKKRVRELIEEYQVKGGTKTYTRTLSGGNQQKVVVAKWMETDPDFVVLDEPTKGIDVGARANIYEIIHSVAARGKGVLVVSSEAEELLSLCHRILVMRNGQIVGRVRPRTCRHR